MTAPALASDEKDQLRINFVIQQLLAGRMNVTGRCTLAASATTTTIVAENCGEGAGVFLMPRTANASAEFGNGTIRVSAVANGSFTITHANNAQTDRDFFWLAIG